MNSLHHKAGFFSPRKEKIDFNKKSYFLQYHKIIFKHKVYLLNRNKKFNILKMEFKSDWSNVSDCISGAFLKSKIDYNYIYKKINLMVHFLKFLSVVVTSRSCDEYSSISVQEILKLWRKQDSH